MELDKPKFELMCKSVADATSGMPENTGISVALWRLRALLVATQWAVERGYKFPGDK